MNDVFIEYIMKVQYILPRINRYMYYSLFSTKKYEVPDD